MIVQNEVGHYLEILRRPFNSRLQNTFLDQNIHIMPEKMPTENIPNSYEVALFMKTVLQYTVPNAQQAALVAEANHAVRCYLTLKKCGIESTILPVTLYEFPRRNNQVYVRNKQLFRAYNFGASVYFAMKGYM
jgi:uncharacterized SAM-binding protein YcdF (DUF218 family)